MILVLAGACENSLPLQWRVSELTPANRAEERPKILATFQASPRGRTFFINIAPGAEAPGYFQ
jgi:hypothetical protein